MLNEVNIAGVYVAPIAVYGVAAVPIALSARWVLWRTRLLDLFAYKSFVTLSLYVITVSLLILDF